MRTMVKVECDRQIWYVYDVGPEELLYLIDTYGNTAVAVLEWGEYGKKTGGFRAEERAKILSINGLITPENVDAVGRSDKQ